MSGACHRCGACVDLDPVGVRDVCDRCSGYFHCCRNCEFYEPGVHNDCREPNAEVVADKEQGNFCDFFRLGSAPRVANLSAGYPGRNRDRDPEQPSAARALGGASAARSKLDALFRKK